jgi:hypothetical protein
MRRERRLQRPQRAGSERVSSGSEVLFLHLDAGGCVKLAHVSTSAYQGGEHFAAGQFVTTINNPGVGQNNGFAHLHFVAYSDNNCSIAVPLSGAARLECVQNIPTSQTGTRLQRCESDIATFYGGGSNNAYIHGWTSDGSSLSYSTVWWSSSAYYLNQVGNRFVSGDFDGNGKEDIATIYDYGSNNAKIHVWTSDGSPPLQGWSTWWEAPAGSFAVSAMAGRMVSGDFNADGKDDIAALYKYDTSGARMYVWLSNTAGTAFLDPGPNGWWYWAANY